MNFRYAKALEQGGPRLEDRVEVRRFGDVLRIVVADGVGGRSHAAEAAELAVRELIGRPAGLSPNEWSRALVEVDGAVRRAAQAGETTAVVAEVSKAGIFGASVGDSGAGWIEAGTYVDLTARQNRRPFLGSGGAVPVGFEQEVRQGTLLLASDGLLKYADSKGICRVLGEAGLENAPKRLLDLVRVVSGALPDDVALAVCRVGFEKNPEIGGDGLQ